MKPHPLAAADRAACEAFATLAYGNPFLPDRLEAERVIAATLGGPARDDRVWHRALDLDHDGDRLAWLSEHAQALAKRIAVCLGGRGCADLDDRARANLAAPGIYVAFYRAAPALLELVRAEATGAEHDRAKVRAAWHTFRDTARSLLIVDGTPLLPELAGGEDHLFAVAYQTFAAFRTIFHNLFGGNEAAATLRAEVWHSCFTRDRLRHARSAYGRMRELPTLVRGESGPGKEIVARAVLAGSHRTFDAKSATLEPRGSFEAVTLAAMPATLVESELFGHRRGSFTGAAADRPGRLEGVGRTGVAFLDEIGDVEPAVQVKVLRVLQERTFARIGDARPRAFEGRIVAATHRDLPALMAAGDFRADLYYRLAADVVRTPPLRELIGGDAGELSRLVTLACRRLIDDPALPHEVIGAIESGVGLGYGWPGNFRELEQCCRAVLIRGEYVPPPTHRHDAADDLADDLRTARLSAEEVTTRYCRLAVDKHGSFSAAGRVLGLDRRTVRSRVERDPDEVPAHDRQRREPDTDGQG